MASQREKKRKEGIEKKNMSHTFYQQLPDPLYYPPDDDFTWHGKLHSLLGVEQLQIYWMMPGKY